MCNINDGRKVFKRKGRYVLMKKIVVAAVVMVVAVSSVMAQSMPPMPPVGWAPEGSPVARWGRLRVSGVNLQSTVTNQTVQLKGMSLDWTSNNNDQYGGRQFYNEQVVAWLAADWRISVIRAAVGVSDKNQGQGPFDVVGAGYLGNEAVTKNLVHAVARAAIWQGIYVIIDWHSHRAHETNSRFPQGERPEAIRFFQEMAEIYKDYPNVIYEIYNEPVCNGESCWAGVKGYSEPVIDAIRAIDRNGVIIVGTAAYSRQIDLAARSPISGNVPGVTPSLSRTHNIMYSLHFYCDHQDGTGQWWLIPFSSTTTIPIFVSESGLSQADGNSWCGGGPAGGAFWYDRMDARNISWVNWRISSIRETSAALVLHSNAADRQRVSRGKWRDSDLTEGGRWIRNRIRGNNPGENRRYSLRVTTAGQGTVSGAGTSLNVCSTVTLTATAASGWRFEGWVLDSVPVAATTNPYTLEVCYDRAGEAVFFMNNLISNSTFTTGTVGWVSNPAGLIIERTPEAQMRVTMPASPGADPTAFRVQHGNTRIDTGRRYRLTFEARTVSGTRTITPTVRGGGVAVAWITGNPVPLTTTMTQFTFEFDQNAASTTAGIIAFNAGGQPGNFIIDNVSLTEIGQATSIANVTTAAVRPFRAAFDGRALVLSGGGRVADVTVYDVAGRVRLSKKVSLSDVGTQVSLGKLPAGVYTVRYKVDGKVFGTNERIVLAR
jgi:endoglucanase